LTVKIADQQPLLAVSPLTEKISRAYIFSLIEAKGNNCNCELCKVWRNIADEFKRELLAGSQ
jgi:hypothetical protein